MLFVIVGAGRVGMRTARVLREEDHEIVLVEPNPTRVSRLESEGFDVILGDGADESTLEAAGIKDADGLAALSGDLVVNFIACMIGSAHGCRTVLRIDMDKREYPIRKYSQDVDAVVHPERLGAIAAKNALVGGNIHAIADVAPSLQLVELRITPSSPILGYTMSELELPANSKVLAFGKNDGLLELPDPDTSFAVGDRVVVIAEFAVLEDIEQILVGESERAPTTGSS